MKNRPLNLWRTVWRAKWVFFFTVWRVVTFLLIVSVWHLSALVWASSRACLVSLPSSIPFPDFLCTSRLHGWSMWEAFSSWWGLWQCSHSETTVYNPVSWKTRQQWAWQVKGVGANFKISISNGVITHFNLKPNPHFSVISVCPICINDVILCDTLLACYLTHSYTVRRLIPLLTTPTSSVWKIFVV